MNNQKIHDYRYWERISTRLQLVEVHSHLQHKLINHVQNQQMSVPDFSCKHQYVHL